MAQYLILWDNVANSIVRSTASFPDYRAGTVSLSSGATSMTVTFSSSIASTGYSLTCNWVNTTDSTPQYQIINITAFAVSGFTVAWSAPLDSANYSINWICIKNS